MPTLFSDQKIRLTPSQMKAIERKAKNAGQFPLEYIRFLIERDLRADKFLDKFLGLIRQDFKRSGITGSQLDQIVGRARRSTVHQIPQILMFQLLFLGGLVALVIRSSKP